MTQVRRLCPAKVNLYLKVLSRREDGYHDLVTVMQPLTLADEVRLTPGAELSWTANTRRCRRGPRIWCGGRPSGSGPPPGKFPRSISTCKKISRWPRGLGGGSSDAAGTLLALNELAGKPLAPPALHDLAAGLGADVLFAGGAGGGRGKVIAEEITDLTSKGFEHKDIAILYRANFQSRVIEECFLQLKIPYRIENGMSFYQRREVKILLDYMRLIHAPESDEGDEALKAVINFPNRYIGRKFIGELERFASKNGLHLYPALKSIPIELPYVRKNVKEFIQFLDPLMEQTMEPGELISLLREALDYDRLICEDEIPTPDDVKIANLNQLQLAATKYNNIESFLAYTGSFKGDTANDEDGVSLMTIHKVKGLEFPVVFVIGLVEGILPSKKGDLEEERRICFVGSRGL